MRLGAENRKELIAAVVIGTLAIVLFVRMVLGPSGSGATPTARPQTQAKGRPAGAKSGKAPSTASLDPTLRLDLLQASESTEYHGDGRNIFRPYEPPPPPIPKPVAPVVAQVPQGPPPPPPITLKFFGFASRPGEARKIFLADGDNIFTAKEGDIVNRRYKILKISANSVEVEDVLNNNRQVIFMSQATGT